MLGQGHISRADLAGAEKILKIRLQLRSSFVVAPGQQAKSKIALVDPAVRNVANQPRGDTKRLRALRSPYEDATKVINLVLTWKVGQFRG